MTTPPDQLAALVDRAQAVLLDFDGPVCSIFAGKPAPGIAAELRQLLAENDVDIPDELRHEPDPLQVLRATARIAPHLTSAVEAALRDAEVEATASAETTPGVFEVIRACLASERPLAIVSNNSTAAVKAWLDWQGIARYFASIAARDCDPSLMKPDPHLVLQALDALSVEPAAAVLVGDSSSDMEASRRARVTSIGYANKPGKASLLATAGANALITEMKAVAVALRHRRKL